MTASDLGLQLNQEKCEIFGHNSIALAKTAPSIANLKLVKRELATLLGCPIGGLRGIELSIRKITESLQKNEK